jgi:hypothetical protein
MLKSKLERRTYDAVVVDLVTNLCSAVFAKHYYIPTIGFWAVGIPSMEMDLAMPQLLPSYVPQILTEFTGNMNFAQRSSIKHF